MLASPNSQHGLTTSFAPSSEQSMVPPHTFYTVSSHAIANPARSTISLFRAFGFGCRRWCRPICQSFFSSLLCLYHQLAAMCQ